MEYTLPDPEHETPEELLTRLLAPAPEVVVVSGGPCAGKSTLIEQLAVAAAQVGRELRILPEVPTQLMQSGVDLAHLATTDREAYLAAQKLIIQTELDFIAQHRRELAGTNGLIVLDRGVSDTYGYMTPDEVHRVAARYNKTPEELGYDSTDKVVYLPSVAACNPVAYEALKATNGTRYESAQEAAATCARTIANWAQHPELHIAEHADFAEKLRRGIQFCLGGESEFEQKWQAEPAAVEQLIAAKTDAGEMLGLTHIVQHYAELNGLPFRLRRGLTANGYEFFHFAVKEKRPDGNRELRRAITAEEYYQLAQYAHSALTKVRYTFTHYGQVWTADALPAADGYTWFLEAEVSHPDDFGALELPLDGPHMQLSAASNADFATTLLQ